MKTILGYDPGGNGKHGVAGLSVDDSYAPLNIIVQTKGTIDEVIQWFLGHDNVCGIGIDTLTKWATSHSGWRPADHWLRNTYPAVAPSVVSPNALYGSMVIGGMAVKSWFFNKHPNAVISETHPKVLYFALRNQRHDWANAAPGMTDFLSGRLGIRCEFENDHEFDSALSCFAVLEFLRGHWQHDLHAAIDDRCGPDIEPFGKSIYAWP